MPARWALREALAARIDMHRIRKERAEYQRLIVHDVQVPQSPPIECMFDLRQAMGSYPSLRRYTGGIRYRKHYFELVGQMNSEEATCAQLIDAHPNVMYWVRNLDRDERAFWLPRATGRFYPDFLVRLKDHRYVVIEYKGADRTELPDEQEKKALGERWAARSGETCVFVWATFVDMATAMRQMDRRA